MNWALGKLCTDTKTRDWDHPLAIEEALHGSFNVGTWYSQLEFILVPSKKDSSQLSLCE